MSDYTQHRDKAMTLRRAYTNRAEAIRSNANLSERGKAVHLRELRKQIEPELAKLKAQFDQGRRDAHLNAQRNLMAPGKSDPTSQSAYRELLDRCRATKSRSALVELWNQSQVTNDSLLEQAVFAVALERLRADPFRPHRMDRAASELDQIVTDYQSRNPLATDALLAMQGLENELSDRTGHLEEREIFHLPALEPELAKHAAQLDAEERQQQGAQSA